MKKVIRLLIEMEMEATASADFSTKIEIREILFTDFDNLFDPAYIVDKAKKALKKLDGRFTMLTLTLMAGNQNDTYPPIVESYRFLGERYDDKIVSSRYNAIHKSYGRELHSGTKDGWKDSDKKEVFQRITQLCERGNRTFIALVKGEEIATA